MKTQNSRTNILKVFLAVLALGLAVFYPHFQQRMKKAATDNSFRGRLIGHGNFRTFEVNLVEYTISPGNGGYEIEVRDRHICHGSANPDDACTAIVWQITPSGKFVSREEYQFTGGLKVGTGRIDSVGPKEDYKEEASYGIGNPIPYVLQSYPDNSHDRRIRFMQDQIDSLLKEIPPAA